MVPLAGGAYPPGCWRCWSRMCHAYVSREGLDTESTSTALKAVSATDRASAPMASDPEESCPATG